MCFEGPGPGSFSVPKPQAKAFEVVRLLTGVYWPGAVWKPVAFSIYILRRVPLSILQDGSLPINLLNSVECTLA